MDDNRYGANNMPAELQRNWGWLLGLGLLFILLGTIGLGMTVALTMASMVFFGVLLLVGGISQLIDVFRSVRWKAALWHAFVGVLYIAGGSLVIYDPSLASSLITALLASILIFIGIARLIMAFTIKPDKGWYWPLFAGITALVLGILIFMQWPFSGLWFIGLFISIEILICGWTYLFLALAARRM